ncbi:MAG: class I SAM-dependent DNA methyltransferase [Saprospiraceae bacterium]
MTKLYSDFATLYHRVYPSFIDYEEQHRFYAGLLQKYGCHSVLEVGCGTGQLARRMLAEGWDYQGMDLSEEMLGIAREEAPRGRFFQGDMRDFRLPKKVEALIIPARSVSYLLENKDVEAAFSAFRNNLAEGGKLIFDFIDAHTHFLNMDAGTPILHAAHDGQTTWERKSIYHKNLQTGWTWDWHSAYFEVRPDGSKIEIARDEATLRAFLPGEMDLFLALAGFKVLERIEIGSYAFKTFVFVATRIGATRI